LSARYWEGKQAKGNEETAVIAKEYLKYFYPKNACPDDANNALATDGIDVFFLKPWHEGDYRVEC
jgi:hypothetical protein